jgi:hypothetical protein
MVQFLNFNEAKLMQGYALRKLLFGAGMIRFIGISSGRIKSAAVIRELLNSASAQTAICKKCKDFRGKQE